MPHMKFSFVLKTNGSDVDYETNKAKSLAERIYGKPNVTEFTYLETMPVDYWPPDPLPLVSEE